MINIGRSANVAELAPCRGGNREQEMPTDPNERFVNPQWAENILEGVAEAEAQGALFVSSGGGPIAFAPRIAELCRERGLELVGDPDDWCWIATQAFAAKISGGRERLERCAQLKNDLQGWALCSPPGGAWQAEAAEFRVRIARARDEAAELGEIRELWEGEVHELCASADSLVAYREQLEGVAAR